MIIDEIREVLEKIGYSLDPDNFSRIHTMLESIRDDN